MGLTKQEGIVLNRRDFGETSRIAIIYTENAGKIQVNAKGARKPKSKFGAALEPLTRLEIVYYHRDNKDLYTLSETSIITSHQKIRENPANSVYGLAMAETLDALTQPEETDAALYRLLGRGLLTLESAVDPMSAFIHYLLHIAAGIGFKPQLFQCAGCGKDIGEVNSKLYFSNAGGAVFCGSCGGAIADGSVLSPRTYKLLVTLAKSDYRMIGAFDSSPETKLKAQDLILTYLRYHTGLRLKTLKTLRC